MGRQYSGEVHFPEQRGVKRLYMVRTGDKYMSKICRVKVVEVNPASGAPPYLMVDFYNSNANWIFGMEFHEDCRELVQMMLEGLDSTFGPPPVPAQRTSTRKLTIPP